MFDMKGMLVLVICFLIFSCQNKKAIIVERQKEITNKLNHLRWFEDSFAHLKLMYPEKYDTNTIKKHVDIEVQMEILQMKFDSLQLELKKY